MLAFIAASAIFGVGFVLILLSTPMLSTPTEISQARELENYKLNYEQLQRKMGQVEEPPATSPQARLSPSATPPQARLEPRQSTP